MSHQDGAGGQLTDALPIVAGDDDRGRVGRRHSQPLGNLDIDIVAVAELQTQILALRRRAVADAGDLEGLGEALGHPGHEILHERAVHAPEGACTLGLVGRADDDAPVLDAVADVLEHRHREGALRPLHGKHRAFDRRGDAAGQRDRNFTNAAHQNTSASTSPPTFCSRASASERTPRGVETMVMPRPLRTRGSSWLPE